MCLLFEYRFSNKHKYQTFKHIDIQIMSFNGSFANYFLPQQNSKASGSEVMLFVQNKHIFDND